MVILFHLQPEYVEICVIALNLLEGNPIPVFNFHGHIVGPLQRDAVAQTDFLHAGFRPEAVQQRTEAGGLVEFVVYHQDVLGVVSQVRRDHVPDLEPHRECTYKHHDGNDILKDDDDLAVDGLGLHSKRSAHDLDGLRLLYEQGRNDAGDDSERKDESNHQRHIAGRNRLEDRHGILQHP